MIVTCGKYRGATIWDVPTPSLVWLVNEAGDRIGPGLRKAIYKLLDERRNGGDPFFRYYPTQPVPPAPKQKNIQFILHDN